MSGLSTVHDNKTVRFSTDMEFSRINSALWHDNKNENFFFSWDWIISVKSGSDLSKMDQICPKWIKLDFSSISK